jgi:chromosome segregation ATPase
MIVTNQLNFLKKPFKKLGQASGKSIMISSTAGEGADGYSKEAWAAFQRDTENLERLKAGLTALADAIQDGKIKFKASLNRKVLDCKTGVVEKGELDEYRLRYSNLSSRKDELEGSVSSDEHRNLEKSLERAEWEHRDVGTEIAHIEEQVARISTRLKTLQKRLESATSKLVRDDIEIEFPDEVQALLAEDSALES